MALSFPKAGIFVLGWIRLIGQQLSGHLVRSDHVIGSSLFVVPQGVS